MPKFNADMCKRPLVVFPLATIVKVSSFKSEKMSTPFHSAMVEAHGFEGRVELDGPPGDYGVVEGVDGRMICRMRKNRNGFLELALMAFEKLPAPKVAVEL